MVNIQRYSGRRVKGGATVTGYAAVGYESQAAWILIPAEGSNDSFHIVEVEPDSIQEVDDMPQ